MLYNMILLIMKIRRFGCIAECCQWLMDNNLVTTKLIEKLVEQL